MNYIKTFLNTEVQYESLAKGEAFQYKSLREVNGKSQEIRFVFLNSYLENCLYFLLKDLIANAAIRFLICSPAPGFCKQFLGNRNYYTETFDYAIDNHYSKNPYYTKNANVNEVKLYNLKKPSEHPLKIQGNTTFWNIVNGGKRKTRKLTRRRR
jgi:hypothetical protein